MKKGCLSSLTLALLGFQDRSVAENNHRAEHKDSSEILLEFRKLVFGSLSYSYPFWWVPSAWYSVTCENLLFAPRNPSSL